MSDTPPEPEPEPIIVVLPDDQEVAGLLLCRQQTPEGWLYKVSVPAWTNTENAMIRLLPAFKNSQKNNMQASGASTWWEVKSQNH